MRDMPCRLRLSNDKAKEWLSSPAMSAMLVSADRVLARNFLSSRPSGP